MSFKKMVRRFINWAIADEPERASTAEDISYFRSGKVSPGTMKSGSPPDSISDNGMTFTVHNAVGGKVIQFRCYNPSTDKTRHALYVINDKEDLAVELGEIITVESLSR